MPNFDPVNDRIDVFSAALGTVAEVAGNTLVAKALASLGFNLLKDTISASAPTNINDTTQGYSVGSKWTDDASGVIYVATSVATGAAVWFPQYTPPTAASKVVYSVTAQALANNTQETLLWSGADPYWGSMGAGGVFTTSKQGIYAIVLAGVVTCTNTGVTQISEDMTLIVTGLPSLLVGQIATDVVLNGVMNMTPTTFLTAGGTIIAQAYAATGNFAAASCTATLTITKIA